MTNFIDPSPKEYFEWFNISLKKRNTRRELRGSMSNLSGKEFWLFHSYNKWRVMYLNLLESPKYEQIVELAEGYGFHE